MFRKHILGLVAIGLLAMQSESHVVRTKYGLLKGRKTQASNGKNVVEFLGVPFAKPPLGELRFKFPVPPDPWDGTLDATSTPNSCVQKTNSFINRILEDAAPFNPLNSKTKIDEDCLYLNMWIPDLGNASSGLPVLMFFYGGGFVFGSIAVDGYDGGVVASEENVIMVTVNYRLSSLGFLSLDDKEVPGNAGLLDQQMAMQWISENVVKFGGDPQRVTIYGQSAGSASVNFHLLMKSSWGYFTRAILQSGFINDLWALSPKEKNDQYGWKLAEFVGCKKKSLKETLVCLQKVNAQDILDNEPVDGYRDRIFTPVVDGIHLKEHPLDLYRQGKVKPCDIMAGTLKDESRPFLVIIAALDVNFKDPKPKYNAIRRLLKKNDILLDNPALLKMVEYGYTGLVVNDDRDYVMATLTAILNDYIYVCSMKELLVPYEKLYREKKVKIFTYLLTYRPSWLKVPKWMGVGHATDVPFTFGHALNTVKNRFHNGTVSPQDVTFNKRLLRYHANFARTGDPSISPSGSMEKIQWPEHTPENEEYLVLAPNVTAIGMRYRTKICHLRNELIPIFLETMNRNSTTRA